MESYPFEYSALYSGQKVSKSSKLLPLSPFMNDERVLCVGSRLKFANVPRTSKNQTIVSKSHYLARLIIIGIHQRNLHTGRKHALCLICNVYWIPSCCGLIRTVLKECLYCKRDRPLWSNVSQKSKGNKIKRCLSKTLWYYFYMYDSTSNSSRTD